MGLFDFAKELGRKVFDTDAEAADKIRDHLNVRLAGVKNLEVDYDDGVCTLSGRCPDEATRNRAVLIAGDTKGVEKVVANDLTYPEPPPEAKAKFEIYEIKSGDTLSGIAKSYYGDASAYTRIHKANEEMIPDPNKIYPGQKIQIPLD